MAFLEIACFNADNAITAWKAGADRTGLCDEQQHGGTTPSLQSLERVKQHVTVPVFVMIRPRGGDFNYSLPEFDQMKFDVDTFKPLADGFVLGVLDVGGNVDIPRTRELVQRALPRPCTFHRAFDETPDLAKALEDVIATGCRTILTSGGRCDARTGVNALADLVRWAEQCITIMPGGGVRANNIVEIQRLTGAVAFHSSGLSANQAEIDPEEVAEMRSLLLRS